MGEVLVGGNIGDILELYSESSSSDIGIVRLEKVCSYFFGISFKKSVSRKTDSIPLSSYGVFAKLNPDIDERYEYLYARS